MVRSQSGNGRFAIDRLAECQSNLRADLQWQRRQCGAIRHGLGNDAGACSYPFGKSRHGQERRDCGVDVVIDQRNRLHGLRRLERLGSDRWYNFNSRSLGDHKVYVDMHRRGWLGGAIRHGYRLSAASSHGFVECKSFKCRERERIDPDLDFDQCHYLHRGGRMERRSVDQRHEVNRRPEYDHRVYIELHGSRGHGESKCDRDSDSEQQWNGNTELGAAHAKYQWNAGHDANRIPHFLRHLRGCTNEVHCGKRREHDQLRDHWAQ